MHGSVNLCIAVKSKHSDVTVCVRSSISPDLFGKMRLTKEMLVCSS